MIPDNYFDQITHLLPIACVDVLIVNRSNKILILKGKDSPAGGIGGFPEQLAPQSDKVR